MRTDSISNILDLKQLPVNRWIIMTALFTAAAATIYLLENFIPRILPFMKIGLANIIPLILLYSRNYKEAFFVLLAKILLGGLISGTLFSPVTLLSMSGGLLALLIMLILILLPFRFSIVGVSIAGAVSHNIGQLTMVRLLLIRENEIFYLTPFLIILGMITGAITGYIAYLLINKINMVGDK